MLVGSCLVNIMAVRLPAAIFGQLDSTALNQAGSAALRRGSGTVRTVRRCRATPRLAHLHNARHQFPQAGQPRRVPCLAACRNRVGNKLRHHAATAAHAHSQSGAAGAGVGRLRALNPQTAAPGRGGVAAAAAARCGARGAGETAGPAAAAAGAHAGRTAPVDAGVEFSQQLSLHCCARPRHISAHLSQRQHLLGGVRCWGIVWCTCGLES